MNYSVIELFNFKWSINILEHLDNDRANKKCKINYE